MSACAPSMSGADAAAVVRASARTYDMCLTAVTLSATLAGEDVSDQQLRQRALALLKNNTGDAE